MTLHRLLLSVLIASLLVVSGCGGGGDFVDGVYTGPTAPAPLTEGDMGSLDGELDEAGGASMGPLTMGAMVLINLFQNSSSDDLILGKSVDELQPKHLPEAVARVIRARVVGAGEKFMISGGADYVTIDLDDVINLDSYEYEGMGWIRIVGSASVRMYPGETSYRVTVAGDVTVEFHGASFYGLYPIGLVSAPKGPEQTVDGSVRLVLGGSFVENFGDEGLESLLLNASLRCEAADLTYSGYRYASIALVPRRTEQEPEMDTYICNGSYGIGVTGELNPETIGAALTIDSNMTVTRQLSGEQFRFLASWTLRAAALSEILEGDIPLPLLGKATLPEDPAFPLSSLSLTAKGTLYSTRLGGSVQFSTTSELDREVPELYLTTQVSWDGGALRMYIPLFEAFDMCPCDLGEVVQVWTDYDGDGSYEPVELGSLFPGDPFSGVYAFTLGFLPYYMYF